MTCNQLILLLNIYRGTVEEKNNFNDITVLLRMRLIMKSKIDGYVTTEMGNIKVKALLSIMGW